MFSSTQQAREFIASEDVKFIDIRFCDLPGLMQHFTIPVDAFDPDSLDQGIMFDGSSIRGFTEIHESDMKLVPDLSTAFIDPFRKAKTLVINHFVVDPFTNESYDRDPRVIAQRAEEYVRSTGIADTVYIGAKQSSLCSMRSAMRTLHSAHSSQSILRKPSGIQAVKKMAITWVTRLIRKPATSLLAHTIRWQTCAIL